MLNRDLGPTDLEVKISQCQGLTQTGSLVFVFASPSSHPTRSTLLSICHTPPPKPPKLLKPPCSVLHLAVLVCLFAEGTPLMLLLLAVNHTAKLKAEQKRSWQIFVEKKKIYVDLWSKWLLMSNQ
jgi:hypothetical protein